MPMGRDKILYADARVGMQVETFLRSEVGQYLVGRAEIQEKEAIEELLALPQWRVFACMAARNKVEVARSMRDWLGDAIQAGIAAGHNLRTMEAAEGDEFFDESP